MASPLLIAALCMGKRQTKFFLFCLAGMGACLLSAYINTFLAALYGADTFGATAEIAPVVEEVMKLLPLLFYLLVFEPKAEQIKIAAVITALSFATFENVCYLIQNGAGHFSFIFLYSSNSVSLSGTSNEISSIGINSLISAIDKTSPLVPHCNKVNVPLNI